MCQGGHVDTISLPGLDRPIDFGVLIYHKLDFVEAFFNRYGVNVTSEVVPPAVVPSFLDYRTAQPVNITQYSAEEQSAALARWVKFGLKYKKYVYPKYDLPSPLGDAAPLARPFRDTVKELKLESIVLSIGERHTANDLLALPTMQAVATFGYEWFDGTPLLAPVSGNNTELYANIQAQLGNKVLLNTRVTSVHRDRKTGIAEIVAEGPDGCTNITAKQVVVGFVPTKANMKPFDTTQHEDRLFAKWNCVNYHNGIVHIDGFPSGLAFDPVSSDPARYGAPAAPNVRINDLKGTRYSMVYVVSDKPNSDAAYAKKLVKQWLQKVDEVGIYNVSNVPEYFALSDHTPLACSISPTDMEAGFWSQLNALQGQRSTSYVGQAVAADLTSFVWVQAQEVIDNIVKKL
jgi:hypothetical protein